MKVSSQQIYNKLIQEENILQARGKINFRLGTTSVTVKQKDAIGSLIQEWFGSWLGSQGIDYAINQNTQEFPDFFLNIKDFTKDLLEIKTFDHAHGPGFDVADFRMYVSLLQQMPFILDTDYLIFSYGMDNDGIITINNLWLKKIWQITRSMSRYPLNVQCKKGLIYKIRPGIWFCDNSNFPNFCSKSDFLSALLETLRMDSNLDPSFIASWKRKFIQNYSMYYKEAIQIPEWKNIKTKYVPEKG